MTTKTRAQTATTKLVGRHKETGETVEFRALYPAMLENVPPSLSAPAAARIRTYREIIAAIKARNSIVAGISFEIPWTMLDFGEEYGRENHVDLNHVARLYLDWEDDNFHNLRVTMVPVYDAQQKLVNVRFDVTDGWHRRTTLLERTYSKNPAGLHTVKNAAALPCFVSAVKDVSGAAASFSAQNSPKEKKPMQNSDIWRARVVGQDTNALAVVEMAARHGFNAESLPRKKGWPFFVSGHILERMMFEFPHIGPEVVARALDLLGNKDCVGVYNNTKALEPNFIGGLCHFIAIYERPGYAHAAGIEQMLTTPNIVDQLKVQYDALSVHDKQALLPVQVSWTREENARFHGRAAAFAQIYSFYVPAPNAKKSYWSKCPSELRQLMHVAPKIANEHNRNNFIAQLQTKLENKNKPAYWRVKFQKSIVK